MIRKHQMQGKSSHMDTNDGRFQSGRDPEIWLSYKYLEDHDQKAPNPREEFLHLLQRWQVPIGKGSRDLVVEQVP